jgi:hypothetical protein
MDAASHQIAALRNRPDRMASALWAWIEHHNATLEQLAAFLGSTDATLERLALVTRPRPGPDWEDDVEIIAISLHLQSAALRTLLLETDGAHERAFGA